MQKECVVDFRPPSGTLISSDFWYFSGGKDIMTLPKWQGLVDEEWHGKRQIPNSCSGFNERLLWG